MDKIVSNVDKITNKVYNKASQYISLFGLLDRLLNFQLKIKGRYRMDLNITYLMIGVFLFIVGSGFIAHNFNRAKEFLIATRNNLDEFKNVTLVYIIIALVCFGLAAASFSAAAYEGALGQPMGFDELKDGKTYRVFQVVTLHEVIFLRREGSDRDLVVKVEFDNVSKFETGQRFVYFKDQGPLFLK